jgi:aryl-alcohol dehydrogenase-like predicted oxidoreductase
MTSTNSPIALGLWPIAGITTVGVTEAEAEATIAKAIECGITTFDTAFSYGYEGESDKLLGRFVTDQRERFHIIGKVGQRWTEQRVRVVDASPSTLFRDAEESLARIGISDFDLLMLHGPDPSVPLEQSAEAMCELQRRGVCREIGVCNVTPEEFESFARVTRSQGSGCSAVQCPLNLLQRESLQDLIPRCQQADCDVDVYWTLMKGLLAGRIGRDHVFAAGDSRPGYAIFQGEARRRAHDILDALLPLAQSERLTLAQFSIGWALAQPGVRHALVGARRPSQIAEIAMAKKLSHETLAAVEQIIEEIDTRHP